MHSYAERCGLTTTLTHSELETLVFECLSTSPTQLNTPYRVHVPTWFRLLPELKATRSSEAAGKGIGLCGIIGVRVIQSES